MLLLSLSAQGGVYVQFLGVFMCGLAILDAWMVNLFFPMMLCVCGRTFVVNAVLCFVLNIYFFVVLSSDHKDRCKCAKVKILQLVCRGNITVHKINTHFKLYRVVYKQSKCAYVSCDTSVFELP